MAGTTSPRPRDHAPSDPVSADFVPREPVEHPDPEALIKEARRRARRRRMVIGAAAATILAVAAIAALNLAAPRQVQEPGLDTLAGAPPTVEVEAGRGWVDGAVWYDNDGLHLGNRVVETAVDLHQFRGEELGVLALVRPGAVYTDPFAHDVWFHPWNGQPRLVGQDSVAGPGGNPNGAIAAWFEGTELVVYDTEAGAVISRTTETPVLEYPFREYVGGYEHVVGNGFMQVSAEEVVWRSAAGVHRLDVADGTSALLDEGSPTTIPRLEDVHDHTRVWGDYWTVGLTVELDGRRQSPIPGLEPPGRLSPDGSFLAAPWRDGESRGVAFVDVGTGESWVVVGEEWNPWISWSYRDVAVLHVERGSAGPDLDLIACHAVRRTCDRLADSGGRLLPNS
jgi:hypothetical protein